METDLIGTKRGRGPNHPLEFKKQLVAQASRPNASVSQVALAHGINVNMLFRWCRQHRAALLEGAPAVPVEMLPVCVVAAEVENGSQRAGPGKTDTSARAMRDSAPVAGMIEIKFAKATVRIDGTVDAATIAAVLRGLRS